MFRVIQFMATENRMLLTLRRLNDYYPFLYKPVVININREKCNGYVTRRLQKTSEFCQSSVSSNIYYKVDIQAVVSIVINSAISSNLQTC